MQRNGAIPATGFGVRRREALLVVAIAPLTACALLWSYWPTLVELWHFWQRNDDYSVGQLVPLVAAYLVWTNRRHLRGLRLQASWWALALFVGAQLIRYAGLYYDYVSLERYSLVLTLASVCALFGGVAVIRRLGWILLFFLLMVPLPGRVHNAVALPLQDSATRFAAFVLEVLGFWTVREGHVIELNGETQVAVAEACSGLRMLTAFVFVSSTLAFLVRRRWWEKTLVVVSSIPIAVACNAARLIVTAVVFDVVRTESAETFFHDFAGIAMMPVAVILVMVELWLLRKLTTPARPTRRSVPTAEKNGAPVARFTQPRRKRRVPSAQ